VITKEKSGLWPLFHLVIHYLICLHFT
jgi:hypothetical protein